MVGYLKEVYNMRKLSRKEIKGYIDAVAEQVYGKTYNELERKQKGVVRINIIARRKEDNMEDAHIKQIDEYIKEEL